MKHHKQTCYCLKCKRRRWHKQVKHLRPVQKLVLHIVRYELWHGKYWVFAKRVDKNTELKWEPFDYARKHIGVFQTLQGARNFAEKEGKKWLEHIICGHRC